MAKARKTPQEKKELEYTRDHFTFGRRSSRAFPKTWKRKKAHANREYRHKSEQLLIKAKPGIESQEIPLLADELTAARFAKSVIRKPLHKTSTVTVEEKVRLKLQKREQRAGRRTAARQEAASAIQTLKLLEGKRLVDFVRRANALCTTRSSEESVRLQFSKDPFDQALHFIYRLTVGLNSPRATICRDEGLRKPLAEWLSRANRILARDERDMQTRIEQKQSTKRTVNAARRAAREKP